MRFIKNTGFVATIRRLYDVPAGGAVLADGLAQGPGGTSGGLIQRIEHLGRRVRVWQLAQLTSALNA